MSNKNSTYIELTLTESEFPDEIHIIEKDKSDSVVYTRKRTCKLIFVPYLFDSSIGHFECSECHTIIFSHLNKFCSSCGAEIQGDLNASKSSNT